MRGNDRTRGGFGVITNKTIKKTTDNHRYSYELDVDLIKELTHKPIKSQLCQRCTAIKAQEKVLHQV